MKVTVFLAGRGQGGTYPQSTHSPLKVMLLMCRVARKLSISPGLVTRELISKIIGFFQESRRDWLYRSCCGKIRLISFSPFAGSYVFVRDPKTVKGAVHHAELDIMKFPTEINRMILEAEGMPRAFCGLNVVCIRDRRHLTLCTRGESPSSWETMRLPSEGMAGIAVHPRKQMVAIGNHEGGTSILTKCSRPDWFESNFLPEMTRGVPPNYNGHCAAFHQSLPFFARTSRDVLCVYDTTRANNNGSWPVVYKAKLKSAAGRPAYTTSMDFHPVLPILALVLREGGQLFGIMLDLGPLPGRTGRQEIVLAPSAKGDLPRTYAFHSRLNLFAVGFASGVVEVYDGSYAPWQRLFRFRPAGEHSGSSCIARSMAFHPLHPLLAILVDGLLHIYAPESSRLDGSEWRQVEMVVIDYVLRADAKNSVVNFHRTLPLLYVSYSSFTPKPDAPALVEHKTLVVNTDRLQTFVPHI